MSGINRVRKLQILYFSKKNKGIKDKKKTKIFWPWPANYPYYLGQLLLPLKSKIFYTLFFPKNTKFQNSNSPLPQQGVHTMVTEVSSSIESIISFFFSLYNFL